MFLKNIKMYKQSITSSSNKLSLIFKLESKVSKTIL